MLTYCPHADGLAVLVDRLEVSVEVTSAAPLGLGELAATAA